MPSFFNLHDHVFALLWLFTFCHILPQIEFLLLSVLTAFYSYNHVSLLASMDGSVDVARILVENGADVNKVDKIKKSSLMVRFLGNKDT